MKVLVTGCAGFIGFHAAKALLDRGDSVVGFDSVNEYYGPGLKHGRLALLQEAADRLGGNYTFIHQNLADRAAVTACFAEHRFDRVIHLAALAGVRYSAENPLAYVESNIIAFTNILESCRHAKVPHLTYASSSSVYGANTAMPYSEHASAEHPLQFYAATKRSNELMAHAYSHLFQLPTTGLRFFTVYGPWGRPDMALFTFTKNIIEGKPVTLFNHGNHSRDFTYVDDIADGVIKASDDIAASNPNWDSGAPDPATSRAPFRIFNIGNQHPVKLRDYVHEIERSLGLTAEKILLGPQPGDMADTFADISEIAHQLGYRPATPIGPGVASFVAWYRGYFQV